MATTSVLHNNFCDRGDNAATDQTKLRIDVKQCVASKVVPLTYLGILGAEAAERPYLGTQRTSVISALMGR